MTDVNAKAVAGISNRPLRIADASFALTSASLSPRVYNASRSGLAHL